MGEGKHLLPKNMRQIGDKEDRIKIYVEDYVFGFFQKMKLTTEAWRVGVLLGFHEEREGVPCLFITGAIETRVADFAGGRLKFTDETWKDVFRRMEDHFPGVGICGWFVYEESGGIVDKLSLKKTHEEAFAHGDKVLLLHDDQGEEAFYTLRKGKLEQMKGYYIYYERNEAMQSYLFGRHRGEAVEEVGSERVIEDFRAKMEDKKKEQLGELLNNISRPGWNRLRTASACAAAVVLVVLMFGYTSQNSSREGTGEIIGQVYESTAAVNGENTSLQAASSEVKSIIGMQVSGQENEVVASESTEAEQQESESSGNAEEDTDTSQETAPSEKGGEESTEESSETVSGRPGYMVGNGETLSQICRRLYGNLDRLEELCMLNGIEDPDTILPGQIIYLP